jgi:excisionase family DNA binding protein
MKNDPLLLLLTIADVADLCQASRSSVRTWIRRGELQVVRLGRSVRIPRRSLERFVLARTT